jgi:hypothetical protein
MNSLGSRLLSVLTDDPEAALATLSGSVTDAIIHPQSLKKLIPYVLKALIVGFFLAEFVTPAISERLDLSPKESLALSFICGYAGVRFLRMGENILMKKIEKKYQLTGGTADKSTLSSKDEAGC